MESYKPEKIEEAESLIETSDIAVNPESGLMVVVIKPDAFSHRDKIIEKLKDAGLHIVKSTKRELGDGFVVGRMYKDLPEDIKKETTEHFSAGPSEIILLKGGNDLLQTVISLTGEKTNPAECDEESIRYLFGEHSGKETDTGKTYFRNAIHRAKNSEEQADDLHKFLPLIEDIEG